MRRQKSAKDGLSKYLAKQGSRGSRSELCCQGKSLHRTSCSALANASVATSAPEAVERVLPVYATQGSTAAAAAAAAL